MKVLFVSNKNAQFHNTNHYRVRALEALGHEVFFFDVNRFWVPARARAWWPWMEWLDLVRMNRELVGAWCQDSFDVCCVVGGQTIFSSTVRRLKAAGARVVLWTSDVPHPGSFQHVVEAAPFYSRVFCAGTEAAALLAHVCDARWLPFACDPQCHQPAVLSADEAAMYRRDISFVGSYYPHRRDVFEALNGYDLGIWGPLWGRLPADAWLRAKVAGGAVDFIEWVKIYAAAKIVLVVHYQDGVVPCYQASPKLFEAMACGAFVLCDDQPDARALFKDGEQVVFFKDAEDLRNKVEYYLAHPDERARIALAGRREALERHTYQHRMEEMLKTVFL